MHCQVCLAIPIPSSLPMNIQWSEVFKMAHCLELDSTLLAMYLWVSVATSSLYLLG